MVGGVVLGHCYVAGQRRAAELSEIDVDHDMSSDASLRSQLGGALQFHFVALAVTETDCINGVVIGLRYGEHGGRIESTAE